MPAHSDRLNKLASALTRLQAQLDPVRTDEVAVIDDGFEERRYRYATLTSVWAAIRPALARHGLSVVQTCEAGTSLEVRLVTTLLHTSGQWIAGTITIPLVAPTPQGYGSALTYARRYGLAAIVGLCIEPDDDGAEASRRSTPPASDDAAGIDRSRSPAGDPGWWKVPCNEATGEQWDAFTVAYARATHVPAVTRDDVCRDFGIAEGDLVDHFGTLPLGQLVSRARRARASGLRATSRDADDSRPSGSRAA